MIYAGIDPGLTGAIAFLDERGDTFSGGVYDTPVTAVARSGKGKRFVLDEPGMRALLLMVPRDDLCVALEQVGPMPKQSPNSSFTFGTGYGTWRGMLVMAQIRHVLVRPQRWQRDMMDGTPPGDGASIVVARRRWPGVDLHRKKDHGRADALLLAEWGRTRGFAVVGEEP